MAIQLQVSEQDLMLKIGTLTMQIEALSVLLERAVSKLTPEQKAEIGIGPAPGAEAPAIRAEDVVTAAELDAVRAARNGAVSPELAAAGFSAGPRGDDDG